MYVCVYVSVEELRGVKRTWGISSGGTMMCIAMYHRCSSTFYIGQAISDRGWGWGLGC